MCKIVEPSVSKFHFLPVTFKLVDVWVGSHGKIIIFSLPRCVFVDAGVALVDIETKKMK